MNRKITILLQRSLLALLLASLAGVAVAQDALYFAAKVGPEGSLSQAGQGDPVVYLRWDNLEGPLPADIQSFQLRRDGELLASLPASGSMDAASIEALYAGPGQQRRMLEIISALKNEALADPEVSDFALNDFGAAIRRHLNDEQDTLWPYLASRVDFNIARARYRGWLDRPDPGTYEYELLAVDAGGNTARVGLALVDTTSADQILPASNFRQVFQGQCDSPGAGKDDYTVALAWVPPKGRGLADETASQYFVSGYDVYRSTQRLGDTDTTPPPRNLAVEGLGLTHDSQGRLPFSGLQKVNDVLLTVDGSDGDEPAFLETQDQLAAAGLLPGDRHAYYLVPRDFAGHYGQTLATIVRVPDLSRPPEPWDVRVYNDFAADTPVTELSWDAVTRQPYLQAFGSGIRVCNYGERSLQRYLAVVGADESCDEAVQRRIRMPASQYRVYQFQNFNTASSFRDDDGDGVSNAVERPFDMQCDAANQPPAAKNHLLPAGGLSQRQIKDDTLVVYNDATPANDQGGVYWYRIVSETSDGRRSRLSAPVRVNFPERILPNPPDFVLQQDGENCRQCEAVTINPDGPWTVVDSIDTFDDLRISCGIRPPYQGSNAGGGRVFISELADPNSDFCENYAPDCGSNPVTLNYPLPTNKDQPNSECPMSLPRDVGLCQQGAVEFQPAGCDRIPLAEGMPVNGKAYLNVTPDEGQCASVYIDIGGSQTLLKSNCARDLGGGELNLEIDRFPACLTAYAEDSDGNISAPAKVGCIGVPEAAKDSRPVSAQPVRLDVGLDEADMQWRLPLEPVAVTLIELRREADGLMRVASVPPAGESDELSLQKYAISLSDVPEISAGESWCARFRVLPPGAKADQQSPWSVPLCAPRETSVPLPDYLPWPQVAEAPKLGDIQMGFGSDVPGYDSPDAPLPLWPLGEFEIPSKSCGAFSGAQVDPLVPPLYLDLACTPAVQTILAGHLGGQLSFMVYRQSRTPEGVEGDYIQVSPRLDFVHWEIVQETIDREGGDSVESPYTRRINDPWLRLYPGSDNTSLRVGYVDSYPLLAGYSYRYQIVHFGPDNRLTGYRQSDWLTPGGES